LISPDASGFVDPPGPAVGAVSQHVLPDNVAVAPNYGVGTAQLVRLLGIQGRMNPAEDDGRPASARLPSGLITG